jgi:MFS family permease
VYTIAAPVFGAWGDRGSRTRPIAIGVFIWSLATVLSGLAQSYQQLFAARALVGIGEAAYVAIAPALLADCFSLSARGRVYSVLNMAIPVGAALGYILGGLIGHHFGWRAAFLVCGAPGMLLAAAALRLPDPPRGVQEVQRPASGSLPAGAPQAGPLGVYLSLLRRAPYLLIVLGYAAYTFGLGGLGFWMPVFLERVRGVPAAMATTGFGAIVVVTGLVGTLVCGAGAHRGAARGLLRGDRGRGAAAVHVDGADQRGDRQHRLPARARFGHGAQHVCHSSAR